MSDAVKQAQREQSGAADPARSVVLEASAGSGKTKVLVDRFLRLCLSGPGTDPRAVLAITFTRKATVEIMERLQERARQLAVLSGGDLASALAGVLDREPTPEELGRAAWFHEGLLDDPAGLGIDTLHAFCQKVLGRFAAEVGLDPRFAVLDERQEADYRTEALDRLESELGKREDRSQAYVSMTGSALGARQLVSGLFARRVHLQRWVDRVVPCDGPPVIHLTRPLAGTADQLMEELQQAAFVGTPWQGHASANPEDLAAPLADALRIFARDGLADVRVASGLGKQTPGFDKDQAKFRDGAEAAVALLDQDPPALEAAVKSITELLLTTGGSLRKFNGPKDSKDDRQAAFARAAAPVLELTTLLRLPAVLALNRTLLACGLRAIDLYTGLKQRDRVVDFQDLEYLALRLLTDDDLGPQVHYRLDTRLDHLLLDEFQDTNRNQWELLEPLLLELLSGGERPRTAFVVGDVKQSIYGFRGADPTVFDCARAMFERQAGPDSRRRLPTNFRSLHGLVQTVGDVCEQEPMRTYLGAAATGARQQAARTARPGEVVLVEPLDAVADQSGHARAADLAVDIIGGLLAGRTSTWDWDPARREDVARLLRHDDILVLARTKTHLAAYEAALRQAGIPYTPAGRGLLARSREVQDTLALLRWLTLPSDDTAGATVLRSPWCRVPEAVVQDLLSCRLPRPGSSDRRRSLREVLRQRAADHGLAALRDRLESWWKLAGLLPLHDLLRRIMRDGELLERAEVAWGEQARFNLLRLVDLALAADQRGGSLRDFVHELEQADALGGEEEGALPGEAGTGRVRVMTVHGAKGLEAPVVLLVDAAVAPRESVDHLLLGPARADGPWLASAPRELTRDLELGPGVVLSPPLARPYELALAGQHEEEAHILYVALTRARDRLYVLGGRNRRQSVDEDGRSFLGWLGRGVAPGSWTDAETLRAGLPAATATAPVDLERVLLDGMNRRLAVWTPPTLVPRVIVDNPSQLDDDHLRERRPAASDVDAGAPPPGPRRRENDATRRGTRLHAWLERACRLGAMPPPPADPARHAEWDEARATFEAPDLAWMMRPQDHGGRGLSEVGVMGTVGDAEVPRRLLGVVDRLVLRPHRLDIIDYKSNRIGADGVVGLVDHYRPQLAAYRLVLSALYPGREVRCWLVWTQLAAAGQAEGLTEVTW